MIDYGLVIFVGAMGEVHANYIKTSGSKLVNCLDRVRLGTDRADDGGTTVIFGRLEFGVKLAEPLDLTGGQEISSFSMKGSHYACRLRGPRELP